MRVTKTPVPPKFNNNVSQWVVSGYKYQFLGLSLESHTGSLRCHPRCMHVVPRLSDPSNVL